MKIIYVTANLPHGSDEAFVVPEIRQLTRSGHEVLVVPRSPHGDVLHGRELLPQARLERIYSPRVLRTAIATTLANPMSTASHMRSLCSGRSSNVILKNLAIAPKALWLADTATRWGAEHIHCHWAGTTASMTMIASAISGIPWSLTAHRWDIVENNLLAEKVRDASFVRFISQSGLTMARSIASPGNGHVRVLHMGVMIPPPVIRQSRRASPVVLSPARLVEVKGHRYLLEAWRILQCEFGLGGELWLAGGGELRTQLEAQCESLGVAGTVRFLGAVPHRELLRLYQSGTVAAVVLASVDLGGGNHEGIPVGLIEAMSYGIPVVATETGGTPELVIPGTGVLTPPCDPEALASAIGSLLKAPRLCDQIGAAARDHVAREYDITRVAEELAAAFQTAKRPCPVGAWAS